MNKEVKVTIIVAVYKSEPFLPKLLDSIINQTYKNLEVILVDDGSPDDSGKICDDYAKQDNRIKVIHKKNGGACEARNYGIDAAKGEYISIIDGDDWLEPDYVEYLLDLACSTNSDMAMTDKIFTTRDRVQTENDKKEIWTSEKAAASIIYPIIPIGPWNKLIKLSLIKENNISFSVPWSGEGLYFTFMCTQYSNQVAVGHRKIYDYRLNNAGSGLTNYNVQMGINALWNIKNIGRNIIHNSKKIENAVNWHIWKNYHFLLKLIIATNTEDKYKQEYAECLSGMNQILPTILLHSEMGVKSKVQMILKTMSPIKYANKELKAEREALANDKMG